MLQQFSDPPWFYRWSLIWTALSAVGTISAVLVALFGDWLRRTLNPPRLALTLLNQEGEKITVRSGNGQAVDEARYYHFIVSNSNRASPATNLDVRLVRIDEPAPGGETKTTWTGDLPIHCRNQAHNPQKHSIGGSMHFDICNVLKSGVVRLCPIFYPSNVKTEWKAPCDFTAFFQARSTEQDTRIVRVRISWDGLWQDGTKEMQDHFRIRDLEA